jgi:hypothetical protein
MTMASESGKDDLAESKLPGSSARAAQSLAERRAFTACPHAAFALVILSCNRLQLLQYPAFLPSFGLHIMI